MRRSTLLTCLMATAGVLLVLLQFTHSSPAAAAAQRAPAAVLADAPAAPETPAAPADPGIVTLFASPAYVSKGRQIQHFEDMLPLGPAQERLPLTLTLGNGQSGLPPFKWFRLQIAGYLVATEKNLQGARQASMDVSGLIHPGDSQILIQAAGIPRATLRWTLTTPKIVLTGASAQTVQMGQPLVLSGANFSSDESIDVVTFNGKPGRVLSASTTSITVQVPAGITPGPQPVVVAVAGLKTEPITINVRRLPRPMLLGTNYWMAPPGAELTIYGRNFAPQPADNQVFFHNRITGQDVPGQVSSVDAQQLVVIVPEWPFSPSQLSVPIYVVSKGIRSVNSLRLDIGNQYHGEMPLMPGDAGP
jgi:hypothetical protein